MNKTIKIIKKKLRNLTKEEALSNCALTPFCEKLKCMCNNCPFNFVECNKGIKKFWYLHKDIYNDKFLDQEIGIEVEVKLTEDEKVILRNIDKLFKYIVRDIHGDLVVYGDKPKRSDYDGDWILFNSERNYVFMYSHLFRFITSEDEEPYLIEDLLKEE